MTSIYADAIKREAKEKQEKQSKLATRLNTEVRKLFADLSAHQIGTIVKIAKGYAKSNDRIDFLNGVFNNLAKVEKIERIRVVNSEERYYIDRIS